MTATSETPYFADTTLRDGNQTPGVCLTRQQKIAIAQALDALGVDELECGIPAKGAQEIADLQALAQLGLSVRLTSWCRARSSDIDAAIAAGLPGIQISFPVSGILLRAFNKTESWIFDTLEPLIRQARAFTPYVSVGAQDASRADITLLSEFAHAAQLAGAFRLRIADTVGILNPFQTFDLVSKIHQARPGMILEFHGHNDLGMATANTLAAFMAGAQHLSTTMTGLGERAGNAATEQVALAIEKTAGAPSRLDKLRIKDVCNLVANIAGRPIEADKPIVGSDVFTHASSIHCFALHRDPLAYQPFSPDEVGAQGTIQHAAKRNVG